MRISMEIIDLKNKGMMQRVREFQKEAQEFNEKIQEANVNQDLTNKVAMLTTMKEQIIKFASNLTED